MIVSRSELAGLFVILIAARMAEADGCFMEAMKMEDVGRSSALVVSPKQEAILATDGNMVQVILRTHFRAGPQELAWIVPVPARPANIAKADDSVFAKLEEITAPRFYRLVPDGGFQFHFGCAASGGTEEIIKPALVRVEETGSAGIFDYTVLSAEDPNALTKWLKDNKYHVPDGAEPILKRYIEKHWYWLAMKVRPEAGKQQTLAPHPISYTYQSKELVFPLVISRISADKENEIVLYVVGTSRYCPTDWSNMTLRDIEMGDRLRLVAPTAAKGSYPRSGTDYEELVRQETAQHDGHLFVTEFSEPCWVLKQSAWMKDYFLDDVLDANTLNSLRGRQNLTRLRAYVLATSMDRDINLKAMADNDMVINTARVASASVAPERTSTRALFPAMLLLPLGALAMPLGGRSKRIIRRACVALACVMIAAL